MTTAYLFEKQQPAGWTSCAYVAATETELEKLKSACIVDDDGIPFCDTVGTIGQFASDIGISEELWTEMLSDTCNVACPIRVSKR